MLKTILADRAKGYSLVDRFLPLLWEGAESVKGRLLCTDVPAIKFKMAFVRTRVSWITYRTQSPGLS
jgi:hypothetical protein